MNKLLILDTQKMDTAVKKKNTHEAGLKSLSAAAAFNSNPIKSPYRFSLFL